MQIFPIYALIVRKTTITICSTLKWGRGTFPRTHQQKMQVLAMSENPPLPP